MTGGVAPPTVLHAHAMTPPPDTAAGDPATGGRTAAVAPARALGLLFATGLTLGALVPLGRIAAGAGVPAVGYMFWFALGGGAVSLAVALARGTPPPADRRHLGYYLVAGAISLALPHSLLVVVLPHIGAGLGGMLYTLPPSITYALALAIGLERPRALRLAGLALGLAGAVVLVGPRGTLPDPAMAGWLLLALGVPLSLAVANIYRTVAWPGETGPLPLATGMLLAAATILFAVMAATGSFYGPLPVRHAGDVAVLVQAVLAGPGYMLFFRLQQVAGPVYLSQFGYVMTAMGVATGALVFGEIFTIWMWLALAAMAAGLALVNRQQR